jgi:hypothetical protein
MTGVSSLAPTHRLKGARWRPNIRLPLPIRVRRHARAWLAALPPLVSFAAWVTAAGLAARAAPRMLADYPRLAEVAVYGIAAMGGIGGLIAFW